MAIITAPTFRIRQIQWTLDRPAQVNRSAYTGVRRVMANPWHGMWKAQVDLATEQSEANFLYLRSFFTQLRGQTNTFQLPSTEGSQYTGSNQPLIDAVAQGANQAALGTLGSELVTNGALNVNTSGWTASGATLSTVSSRMRVTNSGAAQGNGQQTIATTVNAIYRLQFDAVTGSVSPQIQVINGANVFVNQTSAGTGQVVYFSPTTSSVTIECMPASSSSGAYADFANISLKKVTPPALLPGHYVTFPLPSGNKQMVELTSVSPMLTFEPPLREAVAAAVTPEAINPYCLVALADSAFSWSVAQWRQYGISFSVEEAF